MKLRILLVTGGFYPSIRPRAFRATELAIEFARRGHDVTVYLPAGDYDYREYAVERDLKIRDLGWPRLAPDPNNETSSLSPPRLSPIRRRVYNELKRWFDYPSVGLAGRVASSLRGEQNYDMAISFAAPHALHWGMAWTRNRNPNAFRTWIADCGDPFMGERTAGFKRAPYFSFVEKWFCRSADYIAVPTEGARRGYYPEFNDKIRVIPQGFRFPERKGRPAQVNNPVPTFAYAGAFYEGRNPRRFLELLCTMDKPFKFVVYTKSFDVLRPYATRLGERMVVNGYIPRDRLLTELSRMDFLVNLENETDVQVPSKIIDYALAERPILSIHPFRVDATKFKQFLSGDYSQRYRVDNLKRFDIKVVADQFIALAGGENTRGHMPE